MRALDEYREAKKAFDDNLDPKEVEAVVLLRDEINRLGKGEGTGGFLSWNGGQLTVIEAKLARFSETVGIYRAEAETKAEWSKAWITEQKAKQFGEVQKELSVIQDKVTVTQIERELDQEFAEDDKQRVLWLGLGKHYRAILESVDRVLLSTTHRIKELEKEYQRSNKT